MVKKHQVRGGMGWRDQEFCGDLSKTVHVLAHSSLTTPSEEDQAGTPSLF